MERVVATTNCRQAGTMVLAFITLRGEKLDRGGGGGGGGLASDYAPRSSIIVLLEILLRLSLRIVSAI